MVLILFELGSMNESSALGLAMLHFSGFATGMESIGI
jgi:hypothetical protein